MLKKLSEAQNHRCAYCGGRLCDDPSSSYVGTIDHVLPRSLGGGDEWENLVAACWACNADRGNRDAIWYYVHVQEHGRSRLEPGPKPRMLSPNEQAAMRHFSMVLTGTQQLMILRALADLNQHQRAAGQPTLRLLDVMLEVTARGIGPDIRLLEDAA